LATYLVTGCAGFIGWKVTEQLVSVGHSVIGVDNLNDAYDLRLKRWRLAQLEDHADFRFAQVDVAHRETLEAASTAPLDGVVHLAARAGVRASVESPAEYIETNVNGTLNLLTYATAREVPRFVFASSSSVYGSGPPPFREDGGSDRPLSPYAASKKAGEALVHSYHHLSGMHAAVLRLFTVYGPAGRPDMTPFRFVQRIREGRPLTVFGDGRQTRDFTYVDDIARGIVAALQVDGYEIVNLGAQHGHRLLEMIALIEDLTGRKATIEKIGAHRSDTPATLADSTKAENLFGWKAETALNEGLRRLVDWYERERDWASTIDTTG
jgi:nucleoside-diphosphate-sugar epimerase